MIFEPTRRIHFVKSFPSCEVLTHVRVCTVISSEHCMSHEFESLSDAPGRSCSHERFGYAGPLLEVSALKRCLRRFLTKALGFGFRAFDVHPPRGSAVRRRACAAGDRRSLAELQGGTLAPESRLLRDRCCAGPHELSAP